MGEWSDYFEDFPEENSANWIDGRFVHPNSVEAANIAQAQKFNDIRFNKIAKEQRELDNEIARIIKKHSKPKA